ncbi:MAG: hypothetical protein U0457_19435 [Candidatus Sericytochromatia bacterium]
MSIESRGISSNSIQSLDSLRINVAKKAETNSDGENSGVKKINIKIATDKIVPSTTSKGSIPQVDDNISSSLSVKKHKEDPVDFKIAGKTYQAYPLTEGIELSEAANITKNNEIDEIFIKDENGKLYVIFGDKDTKGSLDIEGIKEGYIGKINGNSAKVLKIDNETNTVREGALNPLKSTWGNVKDAGATGITKGIGEIGGTVVGLVLSGTVIKNIFSATQTVGETAQVVNGAVKTGKAIIDVGKAGKTGVAIVKTVGSGLKQGVVYTAIAAGLIGAVAGGFSAYGAIKARNPKNDFTTIDMITDPDLAFKDKTKQVTPPVQVKTN